MTDLETRRFEKIFTISGGKKFTQKLKIYFLLIINGDVIYALLYMGFAIVGLAYHYFFFAFHLLEFIKSQPILRNVLKAVTEPLSQLVFIFIFFIILIYFYSLIIFFFFHDIMPPASCSTVVVCLASIYSNTFTSGGNLGNFIDTVEENENRDASMKRYILDISYTIIMVWFVFQMISGIIIDTFSNLRKAGEEIENDIKNTCFICGLEREKIEKYYLGKEGFNKHLQEHDIASYMEYIFYLNEKDENEYTGIESYIKELIDKENISWLPIERCMVIEDWEMKHKVYH